MKTHFTGVADVDYRIVDADGHVNEPPELWQDRVPSKWRDHAPAVEHRDDGDWWRFDGGATTRPLGLSAVAGVDVTQFRDSGVRYTGIRPGSFDAKARLDDLDADGIWAQVLYPSIVLSGARMFGTDRELQLACTRAYNEWLAELCGSSDGRLVGQALIPVTGVSDAIAELEAAVALGHRGVVISAFPNGTLDPDPDDGRFWGRVADTGLPVAVHIGSFTRPDPAARWPDVTDLSFLALAGASKTGVGAMQVACKLLFAGMLEQHPELKLVLVESNIGWIPTLLEQTDDMFLRYRWFTGAVDKMRAMPSELFHRNFWATFLTDGVGIELRYRMNLEHVMWSTDYPHTGCDWPNSRVTIERMFHGVPQDEVRRMISANAAQLYGLEGCMTSASASTL